MRNWDYRFCWLRDATLTLLALLNAGYTDEAAAWRGWLLRAVGRRPAQLQIMYGLGGERRLTEYEVPWLPGYEGSEAGAGRQRGPRQFQLDVYGEVLDAMYQARRAGLGPTATAGGWSGRWSQFVEEAWDEPDEGIWEVRGPRRHFTHSKVMAWVALDRAVKTVEQFGLEAPVDRWRGVRDAIHDRVCRDGFDPKLNSFVQYLRLRPARREPADDPARRVPAAATTRG